MSHVEITEQIKYIGADDKTLDLFESQYLIPNGVSYNSYLIYVLFIRRLHLFCKHPCFFRKE